MSTRPPLAGDPGEPQHGRPRCGIGTLDEIYLRAFALKRRCLDIGTGLGYSARAMAEVADVVWTVDIDPWVHQEIWPTLPTHVFKLHLIPDLKFDLVFIDGNHAADAVARDIQHARAVLNPHGLILLHDWDTDPGVQEGAAAVALEPIVRIPSDYGLGLYAQP